MTTDIFEVRGVKFHSGSGGIQKGYIFLSSSSLSSTYILGLQGKYVMLQMFYCYFMARAEKLFGIFRWATFELEIEAELNLHLNHLFWHTLAIYCKSRVDEISMLFCFRWIPCQTPAGSAGNVVQRVWFWVPEFYIQCRKILLIRYLTKKKSTKNNKTTTNKTVQMAS